MAFSKELEDVIEAALADGVLTDKERAVLQKKALLEGVDPDELDVVIEGRLAKMKREEDWLRPTPPQNLPNGKVGNVMKCPACGAPYQPGTAVCPECGHVFQNVQANKSIVCLSEGIQKIRDRQASQNKGGLKNMIFGDQDQEVASFIANFPLPNTKDDLLEFILSMEPKCKFDPNNMNGQIVPKAYRTKYAEALRKANMLFPNDPQFQSLIASDMQKKKGCMGMTVFFILFGSAIMYFFT